MAAASLAAAALVGARRTPASAQRGLLAAEHLRVLLGSEHVAHHGELGARRQGLADDRREHAGGVGMARVPEDDVDQEDAHLGIGRLLRQALRAGDGVDHRVGTAAGELLLARGPGTRGRVARPPGAVPAPPGRW